MKRAQYAFIRYFQGLFQLINDSKEKKINAGKFKYNRYLRIILQS